MPNKMEDVASKGMGAVKSTKATLKGLKGVFKTLSEQHGEVYALMKRVQMSSDASTRRSLWPKIREELISHERGELREVYPVLRQHAETRTLAEHHEKEAGELEALIGRIHRMDAADSKWAEQFDHLTGLVKHHADEEEDDIFPQAQRVIGDDEATSLDSRFKAAKKDVAQSLSG